MLIIHGEDVSASRTFLQKTISRYSPDQWDIITMQGKSIEMPILKQAVESSSLFGQEKLIVLENLTALAPTKFQEIKGYLSGVSGHVVWWEKKQLTSAQLKDVRASAVKDFPLPKILFSWLDSLGVSSTQQVLTDLHILLENQAAELVFTMFVRRIRQLMILAQEDSRTLSSIEKVADWQIRKLQGQIRALSGEQLQKLYEEAWEFDQKRKSGQTGVTVAAWLELAVGGMKG